MRRTLVEVLVVLVLVAAVAGVWWWGERQREAAVTALETEHAALVADLRLKADYWASELAHGEAESAFRAFLAGIGPAVLGGRTDSADIALGALLELPGIDFAHLLRPDGEVVSSSDRKVSSAGNVGERGQWALGTSEITSREGDTRGVTELAAPIQGSDGPVAFLWLGYRTDEIKEAARPETLKADGSG